MVRITQVLDDLDAESGDLDRIVAGLEPGRWATPTPADGWTIAHQIAHLAWTDAMAIEAMTDPNGFAGRQRDAAAAPADLIESAARAGAGIEPAVLLDRWRAGRRRVRSELAMAGDRRMPWFGPPMGATSMATARIMETWAHGTDVADALAVVRPATGRLRHVAHLGVVTRDFAYRMHGRAVPGRAFRVELIAPDGTTWVWGPDSGPADVSGPALDFCLLVTRRRHRADLGLSVSPDADGWLDIAQAFAGPPGPGRAAGSR